VIFMVGSLTRTSQLVSARMIEAIELRFRPTNTQV
jgi:hypothetical protein